MSWEMLDDDAATLDRINAEWLTEQFQYEYCNECGGDDIDHVAGPDPLGHMHAYCKPIAPNERVTFKYGETTVVGTVVRRLGARLKIVSDDDDFIALWITDSDAMRWQPT